MFEKTEKTIIDREGNPIRIVKIKEKPIPKEFGWLLNLKAIQEKAQREGRIMKFEFVYNNNGKIEKYDKLFYYEVDSEGQSYIPIRPDQVNVLEHRGGRGFVKVAQLNGSMTSLDPELPVAMKIWDIASGL